MILPLEDNFNDVIGKAQRGLKLADAELAHRADISEIELDRAKKGEFEEALVRQLAVALQLGPDALVALGKQAWRPLNQGTIEGLAVFTSVYGDMTVNSFAAWDAEARIGVFFDTGADSTEMLNDGAQRRSKVGAILLTHTHPDHIADLARMIASSDATAWVCELEPTPGASTFAAGKRFSIGKLEIETRQTSGHSPGGITYVISGLNRPIAIVGDSIFAGSMGGGAVSYADALRNNREQILTLPDETILCPGHGPLTTVGEEKVHNPFFAGA